MPLRLLGTCLRTAVHPGPRGRSTRRRAARMAAAPAGEGGPTWLRLQRRAWSATRAAGLADGARPHRRSPAVVRSASRSGAAAFGGWCRPPRRRREVIGHRCHAPRLTSSAETLRLQFEVAPAHSTHKQPHYGANRPALVELLPNLGAAVRFL